MNRMNKTVKKDRNIQSILFNHYIVLISLLIIFLIIKSKLALIGVYIVLFNILYVKCKFKNYDPKLFYITFLCIIALQGVLLTYFVFETLSLTDPFFYGLILTFIIFIILFIYFYLKKGRYSQLP